MIHKKILKTVMLLAVAASVLSGCQQKKEANFSGIEQVCELATLKCYYHNVAKSEIEANGLFSFLGTGYKKLWMEYSSIVYMGIDMNKVSVSGPDTSGVVTVEIPDAEVLNDRIIEESLGEPLTDKGIFTSITKEEETVTLAQAQENVVETAKNDTVMLTKAKERAKTLIESYIKSIGKQIGDEYKVEWVDV